MWLVWIWCTGYMQPCTTIVASSPESVQHWKAGNGPGDEATTTVQVQSYIVYNIAFFYTHITAQQRPYISVYNFHYASYDHFNCERTYSPYCCWRRMTRSLATMHHPADSGYQLLWIDSSATSITDQCTCRGIILLVFSWFFNFTSTQYQRAGNRPSGDKATGIQLLLA